MSNNNNNNGNADSQQLTIMKSVREFPLFGKVVQIAVYDVDEILLEPIFEDIYRECLRLQKIFNFYDANSELSKLNKFRKMKVSDELCEVLLLANKYSVMTDGLYDVTLGKNMLLRKSGIGLIEIKCSYKDISITSGMVELLHDDVLIDLGSIAKGYIADRIAEYMRSIGIEKGFVNARGDLIIYGDVSEIVLVQDPRDNDKFASKILFFNNCIATSGDYSQYYGNHDNNHILQSKDVISVSVLAKSLAEADAAATCLFVIGLENISRFMIDNPHMKAFVIDKNLQHHYYNGFREIVYE